MGIQPLKRFGQSDVGELVVVADREGLLAPRTHRSVNGGELLEGDFDNTAAPVTLADKPEGLDFGEQDREEVATHGIHHSTAGAGSHPAGPCSDYTTLMDNPLLTDAELARIQEYAENHEDTDGGSFVLQLLAEVRHWRAASGLRSYTRTYGRAVPGAMTPTAPVATTN